MKRTVLAGFGVLALGAMGLFIAATCVSPWRPLGDGRWFTPAYDYSLRMTEIKCLRSGVDPYAVWKGEVVLPPYRPNWGAKVEGPEFTEDINAYVPWAYTLMLPLSYLPPRVGWAVYFLVMMASLAAVFLVLRRNLAAFVSDPHLRTLVSSLALLPVAYPAWSNMAIGNFSVIVLAAAVLMADCLARGRDVGAGLCWAVAMIKPQLGLAFAVPLLMRRKFLSCAVAAAVCLLLSLPPAAMCGVSPLKLIAEAPAANAFCFQGCGTYPFALCGLMPANVEILVALAAGVVVSGALTAMLRKDAPWFVYLMPAGIVATTWTYASTYGHVLNWFFFAVALSVYCARRPRTPALGWLLGLSALSMTRIYNAFNGFCSASGLLAIPEMLHRHLDSLNSLADLALAAVLVCMVRKLDWSKTP